MMHDTNHTSGPATGDDLESLAGRVDHAIEALAGLDEPAREKAMAVREAIEAFHRLGLTTIVKRLKEDPRGKEILFELVDDPGVRALLAMHGIIRSAPPSEPEPPLELVQIQLPGAEGGWHPGPRADEVTSEKPFAFEAGGEKIIVVNARGRLRAFRNACGHIGLPLDRGIIDDAEGTITCPWHAYRFDADSGACLSAPDCRLEPFPLRVVGEVVEVKV
jgi:nitrite reductase/ring-hydroxylating ferredoxin subunit